MKRARRLRLGLSTLLGFGKRGFFIPYRYAGQIPARADRGAYEALEPIFAEAAPTFAALLKSMTPYAEAFRAIGGAPPPEPRFDQDWFPRLDAAALYVFVREAKPARIVEIGSGHSTRFMARAARDGGFSTEIVSIDPAPRADIEGTGATVIRRTVQDAGLATFSELGEGDILSIDSSHILMPGTDVDLLFNHVLPMLKRGVMVHVHDIFLPDDYPPEWADRHYNEQYLMATWLLGGSRGLQIELPAWFAHRDPELGAIAEPLWSELGLVGEATRGCSFWVRTV